MMDFVLEILMYSTMGFNIACAHKDINKFIKDLIDTCKYEGYKVRFFDVWSTVMLFASEPYRYHRSVVEALAGMRCVNFQMFNGVAKLMHLDQFKSCYDVLIPCMGVFGQDGRIGNGWYLMNNVCISFGINIRPLLNYDFNDINNLILALNCNDCSITDPAIYDLMSCLDIGCLRIFWAYLGSFRGNGNAIKWFKANTESNKNSNDQEFFNELYYRCCVMNGFKSAERHRKKFPSLKIDYTAMLLRVINNIPRTEREIETFENLHPVLVSFIKTIKHLPRTHFLGRSKIIMGTGIDREYQLLLFKLVLARKTTAILWLQSKFIMPPTYVPPPPCPPPAYVFESEDDYDNW